MGKASEAEGSLARVMLLVLAGPLRIPRCPVAMICRVKFGARTGGALDSGTRQRARGSRGSLCVPSLFGFRTQNMVT